MKTILYVYQSPDFDIKLAYKGYKANFKNQVRPFEAVNRDLISRGYKVIDEIPLIVAHEPGENYEPGDFFVKEGAMYEVLQKHKASPNFDDDFLKGRFKDNVPRILKDKIEEIEGLAGNRKKTEKEIANLQKLKQGIELVSTKVLETEISNATTGYISIIKESFLAEKTANYWFESYLEIECDTPKNIVIQLKNGDIVLSESFMNIEIANMPKIFNVKSKSINIEQEFPASFEILFRLFDFGGTATVKNARLTIFRQQLISLGPSPAPPAPAQSEKPKI